MKYRKIDPKIWNDAKFNDLSDHGKLVFFFLLTHPHMTPVGAMRGTMAGLAEELGWETEAFREAFCEALSKGMVKHDSKAHFISLPNFMRYNGPESPNVVKAWAKCMDDIPECKAKNDIYSDLKALLEGYGKGFLKAFELAFGKGMLKTIANQEQEQEQEQDITPPYPPQGGERDDPPKPRSGKPKKSNGKLSQAQQTLFDRFWAAYPKHKSKGQAITAWKKISPDEQLVTTMIAKIEQARTSEDWIKRNGQYIPHPATWLNAIGWEDEYKPASTGKPYSDKTARSIENLSAWMEEENAKQADVQ